MIFESSQSPIKGTMLCCLLTNNKLIILEVLDTQTIWSWLFDSEFHTSTTCNMPKVFKMPILGNE